MKKMCIGLILLLVFGLIACNMSKDLSRGKASEILSKGHYGQMTATISLYFHNNFESAGISSGGEAWRQQQLRDLDRWLKPEKAYLDLLKNQGWITYNMRQSTEQTWTKIEFTLQPTNKLQPYIIKNDGYFIEVKLSDMVFDKITGISKTSEDTCVVEFTTKPINTPLYGVVKSSNDVPPTNHSASFRRYDDGWRLEQ